MSAARQLACLRARAVRGSRRLPNRPRPHWPQGAAILSQQSFDDLGVSAPVPRALAERGITAPFAIQRLVLPGGLAVFDVLAKSPMGSGKTLAFTVPIVERTSPG